MLEVQEIGHLQPGYQLSLQWKRSLQNMGGHFLQHHDIRASHNLHRDKHGKARQS